MKTRVVQGDGSSPDPRPGGRIDVPAPPPPPPDAPLKRGIPLLRRHPLMGFVALSYALTWCLLPIGTFVAVGPLLAAVLVVAATEGRPGLRRLAGHALRWRVRWVWYAAAVGIPLAVHLVTVAGNTALGGPAPSSGALTPWYALAMVFALRLVNPLDGPLGEEPAWRGYLLPHLQARSSPLISTGIVCLVVVGWHLPLFFLPAFGLRPFEAVATIGSTVVYTWLFNRSGGSAFITLIAHAAEGSIRTGQLWPAESDATRAAAVYTAAWAAAGIVVLVADRRAWTTAPASAIWPDPAAAGNAEREAGTRRALSGGRQDGS
jgi:membrane protease YdiL (CAAX protease family)